MFAKIVVDKVRRANYWPLSTLPYSWIFLKIYYVKNKKMQQILMFPSIYVISLQSNAWSPDEFSKIFWVANPFSFTPPWIEWDTQRIFAHSISLHLLPQNCKQTSKLNENSKWRCKYFAKIIGVWHVKSHSKWSMLIIFINFVHQVNTHANKNTWHLSHLFH